VPGIQCEYEAGKLDEPGTLGDTGKPEVAGIDETVELCPAWFGSARKNSFASCVSVATSGKTAPTADLACATASSSN
jgi:hypothetical protein